MVKQITLAVVGVLLAGCSPLALLNQTSADRHYERTADVAYGPERRHVLDVYRPLKPLASRPLVVFFYGGGWRNGAKENYEFVASALTEAGIAVVIPDYRLYPNVTFPAFVEDAAAAVSWTVEHAHELGVSDDAVFLMGLSGPYDFLPIESSYLVELFPETDREQSQPVNHVTPAAPPALLIHGTGDKTVRIENSISLAERLQEEGVAARLTAYDGVGHVSVMLALAPPLDFLADTLQDSRNYIIELLGERIAAGE